MDFCVEFFEPLYVVVNQLQTANCGHAVYGWMLNVQQHFNKYPHRADVVKMQAKWKVAMDESGAIWNRMRVFNPWEKHLVPDHNIFPWTNDDGLNEGDDLMKGLNAQFKTYLTMEVPQLPVASLDRIRGEHITAFWKSMAVQWPLLAEVAILFERTCGSAGIIERSFSVLHNVDNEMATNIDTGTVGVRTRLLFHKELMLDIRGFPPLRVRRAPNQEGERVPKRAAEEENIYY